MDKFGINIASASIGALSAVSATHPLDLYKTKLQLGIKSNLAQNLYQGITPAIFRELTYTTLRIGMYEPIKGILDPEAKGGIGIKFISGSAAGVIGTLVGNPFDIAKIQMMSSTNTNSSKDFVNIFKQIISNGEVYKGLGPNLSRVIVLNGTKMATYDHMKQKIKETNLIKSNIGIQFSSAFVSGFFMACAVTPFDVIRTNIMGMPGQNISGLIKKLGLKGLYKGFIPLWLRFAPNTCIQLVMYDQAKIFLTQL